MLVAIIADIHANAVSLRAVIRDIKGAGADNIVCLGDVASTGPQPQECIALLRTLDAHFVLGNADAELLDVVEPSDLDENTRRIHDITVWCASKLGASDLKFLRSFAPLLELPLEGGAKLLCYHGSPRSYDEIVAAGMSEEELDEIYGENRATLMAGGHTHIPMLRRYRDSLLLNPGSVGLPYEFFGPESKLRSPSWAEYALVRSEGSALGIELRRVPVDSGAVANSALASGMPHAEWWAQDWLAGGH